LGYFHCIYHWLRLTPAVVFGFPQGEVTSDQAIMMVEPRHLDQLLHPMFENEKGYQKDVITRGLAASPGAAVGKLVFTAEDAEAWKAKGEAVILCRQETSPEDVGGMHAAEGILTSRGGMTSHAAVVARGWGKPCVCGCETLIVDYKTKSVKAPVSDGNGLAARVLSILGG
jgi:pyruvate,orthophosphate dikinase